MQSLRSFLGTNRFEASLPAAVLDDQTIFFVFRQVVTREYGARGAANLEARYLKDQRLFVAAKSSLWAQELQLSRRSFCALLNAELGEDTIREIKVENIFS